MLYKAQAIHSQMIAWRRDFHMHPELGFLETRTAGKVAEILREIGCRVRTGVGVTGVVAELGQGKPVIAIRSDMDALPITEANDAPYKSQIEGVMHACGHDAHMAMLLGAADLLTRETLPGTVRFLFQPSEEMADAEGISGAPRMIAAGAMQDVDCVIALHVAAGIKTGEIEISERDSAAGVDTFYGKVLGRGGHGSTPHKVVDPIFISGHVILALHSIVSRRIKPYDPAVISIGTIKGGVLDNIIPEVVEMSGTIRYLKPEVQARLHEEIERAFSVAKTMGGDYELRIEIGYPPIVNDAGVARLIEEVGCDLLGAEHVKEPLPEMGSEDFGFFMQEAPGAMFILGCRIEGDERRHHDPRFDVFEDCLPIGAAIFAETALRFLTQTPKTQQGSEGR
ncbi:MAG: amidohydrolase [Chloroflexi bacterium]|nr:amidohydrolase [Chloroflexota bacterium]